MLRRLATLMVVLLLLAGGGACWVRTRLMTPHRGYQADEVYVDLPPGTSVSGIAGRLTDAGVVSDPLTFRLAARVANVDRKLQAGEYRFSGPATPFDVVRKLARGDVYTRPITFPEGLTIQEMAAIFEKSGIGTAAEFERAAADGSAIAPLARNAKTLEGYLFPDTYGLPRSVGAEGTVKAMMARFEKAFDTKLRADAESRGLSVREAVTLASLIEKETAQPSERPTVSAVYHNRLKRKMPLQCDPTIIYALMRAGRWNGNLRREDLQLNSPYNTYRFPGLPPGPIASPGQTSLEAAVRPADVPYLFFVSRNDGTHVFATTLEEHNRNVTEWQVKYFKDRN